MPLRIGLHAGPQDTSYQDLRRLWKLADSSGFYWVSIWDHFYENPTRDGKGDCFEGLTAMAALAAETTRVKVGSLVFAIGYRSPALLAKAAATIDHISKGRLELGIGGGWYELEYRSYGYAFPPVKTRLEMLEEGAHIIHSMFNNEETTFQGRHYSVDRAYLHPKPVQKNPRLWIGGLGEKVTLRIAAKYAGGWNAAYIGPELYRAKSQALDRWCEAEGRDPKQIQRSVNLGFYMGATRAEARRKKEELRRVWGEELTPHRQKGMLTGIHRDVIEQLAEFVRVGATDVNIAMRGPYDFDAFQSFIEDVMPAFT